MPEADVLVVGAGILGLSAAYFLAQRGFPVLVLEREAPLACTSDKSTECYRVFWPGEEALASLVGRSLELLGPFGEAARPRPRGYLYLGEAESLFALAQAAPHAGPLRVHPKAATYPSGAEEGMDLLLPGALGEVFPYLVHLKGKAGLHVRKAGWLSAHGLGMALLEALRKAGGRLVAGAFLGLEREGGRPRYARVRRGEEEALWPFAALVLAPGPGLPALLAALDPTLPVAAEPHFKAWFPDPLGLFPRETPLLIWNEGQEIFTPEEQALLRDEAAFAPLLGPLPPGAHGRPEGEGFLALYNPWPQTEVPWACGPTPPPWAGEVALRGLFPMLPGLRAYLGVRPRVDGGYYVRTPENLPLLGPVAEGVYLLGAFSGYGVMAALGAGEALARMVAGEDLPSWAWGFLPSRYKDPGYRPQGAAARAQL
ncbi:NAD(P)/FAD-dependent oxidoreductase [Thermus brockianus]|uniref:FAD-dependent oxidoreductase n=1 Tax=Thermus brockianus TaxID=56956 RepID=A0ABM7XGJ5_THEBO|nr:FAD-binding oxidoreductase [Thermus brockianus]BDG15405.1 FAD-dependent oxidoreductase [Thermus brockianus]